MSQKRLNVWAFLLIFMGIASGITSPKLAFATTSVGVEEVTPEQELAIDDDIVLETSATPTPKAASKKAVSVAIKKRVGARKVTRSRSRARGGKLSSVQKMRMEVSDLMKKVKAMEAAQKKKKKVDEPTLSEAVDKKLGKKIDSGNDKIKLAISGHVNRAVIFIDNRNRTKLHHVDNDNSPTRFRFVGEGKLNPCTKVGTNIELQAETNSTSSVDVNSNDDAGPSKVGIRKAEVYVKHKKLGDVYMGQGSTASDDTTEQDLSGTYVCTQASGIEGPAQAVEFVDKGTGDRSGVTVASAWNGMDGNSRRNRIRYDTPDLNGLRLSASHGSADSWDAAAKYKGDYKGYKIAAAIGYLKKNSAGAYRAAIAPLGTPGRYVKTSYKQLGGSVSALVPLGFNITLAAGRRNSDDPGTKTVRFWLARLGFKANPFNIGDMAFAVDYGNCRDLVDKGNSGDGSSLYGNGSNMKTIGFSAVQKLSKISTELYATVRGYRLDCVPDPQSGLPLDGNGNPTGVQKTRAFKDIIVCMAGARIKF